MQPGRAPRPVRGAYFARHPGGGLGAARSRLPIGPGTRRSGSESLQSFIEGGVARALRGALAAPLRRGSSACLGTGGGPLQGSWAFFSH